LHHNNPCPAAPLAPSRLHTVVWPNTFYTMPRNAAPCKRCGGGDDCDLMLLGDTCNVAVHATCHVPPFKGPLEGDWLCGECRSPKVRCAILARNGKRCTGRPGPG
jgi:hypothetical protein